MTIKEQIRNGVLHTKRFAAYKDVEDKDGALYFKASGEIVDMHDYSDAAKQIEAEMDEYHINKATVYVDTEEYFTVIRG
jgi:hypothetical protein